MGTRWFLMGKCDLGEVEVNRNTSEVADLGV